MRLASSEQGHARNYARHYWRQQAKIALFVLPALAFLLFFFVYPLLGFLSRSVFDPEFTLENYIRIFTDSIYLRITYNTLQTAFVTTLLCLIMGYPAAWSILQENQVRVVNHIYYGPTNLMAGALIPQSLRADIPTSEENINRVVIPDFAWWQENFERVNEMWRRWKLQ